MFCCLTLQVAGVPMTVLTTSIIFEKKWLATQIDAAAACPTSEGNNHVWRAVGRVLAMTKVMPFKQLRVFRVNSYLGNVT